MGNAGSDTGRHYPPPPHHPQNQYEAHNSSTGGLKQDGNTTGRAASGWFDEEQQQLRGKTISTGDLQNQSRKALSTYDPEGCGENPGFSTGRLRIIESREVPDDDGVLQPQHTHPDYRSTGSAAGSLIRGAKIGSAFDIDVEKGNGSETPTNSFSQSGVRKGSWAETMAGVVDGFLLAAGSVVKDTVRDWENPHHQTFMPHDVDYGGGRMPGAFKPQPVAPSSKAKPAISLATLDSVEDGHQHPSAEDMLSQPIEVPHTGEDRVTSALSRQLQKLELKPQPISHPLEICAPQNSEQIPPNHRYHLPAISTQPLSIPQFSAPPSARRIDGEPYPPQSAIPHSPPKDIGDGILARRAYNNNNVTASPLPVPVPVVLQEKQPANRQNQHHTDESPLSPNSEKEEQQRLRAPKLSRITKYNSCSTLFVESTISNSDLTDTLRCVASALVNHMKNPPSRHEGLPDILSEELHPLSNHIRFHRRKPREDDVFRFLECLFNAAELTAECGIITLIYIERLLKNAQLHITAGNWTRIVLGALLLASKVWDDHAVWNVDFVQIFPDVAVDDMNDLERYYIATLEFNVNIKSSEYAKYYFSLRELTENSNRQSDEERKPLTTRDVGLLDARQPRPTTPIPLQPLSSSGTAPLLLPLSHAAAPTRSFSPSYKASPTPSNKSGLNTSLTPRGLNDAAAAAAALPRNALAGSLRRSASDYIFVPSKPFATIL